MLEVFYVQPSPIISTTGPKWLMELEKYIQETAKTPEMITLKNFPEEAAKKIESEDGEFLTQNNLQIAIIIMGRLAYTHGITRVPISEEDTFYMTQALVLDKAMSTLQKNGSTGNFHAENLDGSKASGPLGSALKLWLEELLKNSKK